MSPMSEIIMYWLQNQWLYHFSATRIGFEETSYTVNEEIGRVVVSVAILDGELSNNVRVRFTTENDTASIYNHQLHIYIRTYCVNPLTSRST